MTGGLVRREDRDTQREEGHVTTETRLVAAATSPGTPEIVRSH